MDAIEYKPPYPISLDIIKEKVAKRNVNNHIYAKPYNHVYSRGKLYYPNVKNKKTTLEKL
jgi:hypothetical protein